MSFSAFMPQPVSQGDKVQIFGNFITDAQQFTISFVNDTCECPENITYHFEYSFREKIITQTCKENGEWMQDHQTNMDIFDGNHFGLEFVFEDDDNLTVYSIAGGSHNFLTTYQITLPIGAITTVQVQGDVNKILQCSFLYPDTN